MQKFVIRKCLNAFYFIIIYKTFMIHLIYYTYGFVQSIGHSSNYKLLLNIFLIDDYSCLTNTIGFLSCHESQCHGSVPRLLLWRSHIEYPPLASCESGHKFPRIHKSHECVWRVLQCSVGAGWCHLLPDHVLLLVYYLCQLLYEFSYKFQPVYAIHYMLNILCKLFVL